MADTAAKTVLSVCATVKSRLSDLVIKDGQLIFVRDAHRLAFDYDGKRVFYNQIEEIESDAERLEMTPVNGAYYFVISNAILWTYQDKWVQLTTAPKEMVCIGTEFPEYGQDNTLYVNKTGGISVWDEDGQCYYVVADKSGAISNEDIIVLFA